MGEMAEWLKAHAWNACMVLQPSWVRIPLSPPLLKFKFRIQGEFFVLELKETARRKGPN
jgi:hypothetical protein